MKPIDRYKKGKWNYANIEERPDGSQVITLYREGDKKPSIFRVKNLYQDNEQEVDIDTGQAISKGNL